MTYNPNYQPIHPDDDALSLASANYWAGRTGRQVPPAPTWRSVDGQERFGRYLDPYGCQRHMEAAKRRWRKFYIGFYTIAGIGLLTAPVDWFVLIFIYPILGAMYFLTRRREHEQYSLYKVVQDAIVATGEPQWVPYDKRRLRMIEHNPQAIIP